MKPKDVSAEFVEIAVEVFEDQAHEHCSEEEGCPGNTRPYHEALVRESLAEILPEHEKQLQAEVQRLRVELAKASDALCAVGKAALVVAPTLAKPYPDAPETSPWQQFMERPVRDAYNLGRRIRRDLKEARDGR